MNKKPLKVLGYVFVFILLLNLLLFALRIISGLVFWSVIVVGAVFVYWVLPKIKRE